jgi:hypothetical protein
MIMRHLFTCLLLACAGAVSAQPDLPDPALDPDFMQAATAWLMGDDVKARRHFRAAAERGHALGQYNLAMMLLHREGGPCRPAEAEALLRKAADGGVDLAREALDQMQVRVTAHRSFKPSFPCPLPGRARRSTPAVLPLQSTMAR